jgi:plastocyanin
VRRALLAAFVVAAAIVVGALAAAPYAVPAEREATGSATAVGVAEREFRIAVYRRSVTPGTVRFNVRNYGEDAHNLVVRGPRDFRGAATPEIRSGQRATLTVRFRRPGTYRLLCTTADHLARGMRATLRVRR